MTKTKCGFVAIMGAPNAGKSTLVNSLVGSKVSIVSHKVQTTRTRVLGIVMHDQSQIILIDTPGVFAPKKRLEKAMVKSAISSIADADVVAVIIDANLKNFTEAEQLLDQVLAGGKTPVLILNKVDLIAKDKLLTVAAQLHKDREIAETFMISALQHNGLEQLQAYLAKAVPEGPWLYPEDQLSDLPERMLAAEITREKIFLYLHDELPYAITVETEKWEEFKNGSVKITQTIYVQRDSQKSIVLGKNGNQVKLIGQKAREELEALLERQVHLFLHVKVKENWQETPGYYRLMGLEY